jgi:hypothetical protein
LRAWGIELRRFGWIHPLLALALTVAVTDLDRVGWIEAGRRLLRTEFFFCVIGLVITGLYAGVANRLLAESRAPLRQAMIHTATLVAGVGVGGEVALLLHPALFAGPSSSELRPILWRIGASIGAVTMIVGALYDRIRARAEALEIRAARAEGERLRAQLLAAQARMHPHFLFNSLNTLADLIDVDPTAAVDATERLASLLRYALEGERQTFVALARELEVIDDYIALERLRFGERLRFAADVEPAARDIPVPPFILQPAVENAVKHGVARARDGATIRVAARCEGGRLECVVDNDGVTGGSLDARGTKSGEDDLRLRLRLLYGAGATLECGPRPQGGYRVRMVLDPRAAEGQP